MTARKTKIKSPRELTVKIDPIRGFNDILATAPDGFVYPRTMENFDPTDGTLVPCDGFDVLEEYVCPTGVTVRKCYLFKNYDIDENPVHKVLIYCSDKYLYVCPFGGGTFTKLTATTFDSDPAGVPYNYNGKNVMIFSKSGGGICIFDGTKLTIVPDAPEITSMCIHFERLFVTTRGYRNTLWFSDDFNPTNWNVSLTEAGFIEMDDAGGDLIKAVSFGDYLYVFRSFGITRISAYTDQRQFSATNLFISSGRIFADSVIVCGDCILFMATNGLYRFDGVSTQKISAGFEKRLAADYVYVKGMYFNGYAYIRVKVYYDNVNTVQVLRLDPRTLEAVLINGATLSDFMIVDCDGDYQLYGTSPILNNVVALNTEDKLLFGNPLKMIWENGESDFGVPAPKTLTKFTFYSKSKATVSFTVDGVKHSYVVEGSDKPIVLKPNLKGVKFKLRFDAYSVDARIAAPELKLEYYS